uniref:Uncharacterized protein n=1 Tax=Arundo donax TaxID=35708 RepID=A0A0A9A1L1_ARUDO
MLVGPWHILIIVGIYIFQFFGILNLPMLPCVDLCLFQNFRVSFHFLKVMRSFLES